LGQQLELEALEQLQRRQEQQEQLGLQQELHHIRKRSSRRSILHRNLCSCT
jgi:hypothetical protein